MCCSCSGCLFAGSNFKPLAVDRELGWNATYVLDGHALGGEVCLKRRASPKDGEGEALPLCRELWREVQLFVANLHAAETLHY